MQCGADQCSGLLPTTAEQTRDARCRPNDAVGDDVANRKRVADGDNIANEPSSRCSCQSRSCHNCSRSYYRPNWSTPAR
jgi:hypothetical protein